MIVVNKNAENYNKTANLRTYLRPQNEGYTDTRFKSPPKNNQPFKNPATRFTIKKSNVLINLQQCKEENLGLCLRKK